MLGVWSIWVSYGFLSALKSLFNSLQLSSTLFNYLQLSSTLSNYLQLSSTIFNYLQPVGLQIKRKVLELTRILWLWNNYSSWFFSYRIHWIGGSLSHGLSTDFHRIQSTGDRGRSSADDKHIFWKQISTKYEQSPHKKCLYWTIFKCLWTLFIFTICVCICVDVYKCLYICIFVNINRVHIFCIWVLY